MCEQSLLENLEAPMGPVSVRNNPFLSHADLNNLTPGISFSL